MYYLMNKCTKIMCKYFWSYCIWKNIVCPIHYKFSHPHFHLVSLRIVFSLVTPTHFCHFKQHIDVLHDDGSSKIICFFTLVHMDYTFFEHPCVSVFNLTNNFVTIKLFMIFIMMNTRNLIDKYLCPQKSQTYISMISHPMII